MGGITAPRIIGLATARKPPHMGKLHNQPSRLEYRRDLRKNLTAPEQVLWASLRGGQLGVKFRRQHSIGHYIVDFFAAEASLVIEIDGESHCVTEAAREYDRVRDEYLCSLGFHILRISNHDVLTNREGVLQHILAVMTQQPPPRPSP